MRKSKKTYTLAKSNWPAELKFDTSIYDVIPNSFTNKAICISTIPYKTRKMLLRILDTFTDGEWITPEPLEMMQDPIRVVINITLETNDYLQYASDNFVEFNNDDFKLQLFAYHDGLMVHSLIVNKNKRGSGIGTEVMNKLYDISEDMDIPLYLIPFPAIDKFEQSKIFDIIKPLHKWYDALGFGPVDNHPTAWSNY
jgi:GNAT superfamily N-acetyltransferase